MEIINAFNGIFTIVTMIGIGVIVAKKTYESGNI